MSMETYRLEVRERGESDGIDVDLYGDDDLVEASTRASYENYGLEPREGRNEPRPVVDEVTADVTTTDLQLERHGGGFSVRVLGDREELLTERLDDEAWGLEPRG